MTLNDPVSVTSGASGGLTLALDDGGTAFYNSALSSPATLVFDYVVSGGQQTPNLTVFTVDLASGTTDPVPAASTPTSRPPLAPRPACRWGRRS